MIDDRDTEPAPHPPEEESPMREGQKPDRSAMSDRELLLSLHDRLDGVDTRLAEGDREFREQKTDLGIMSSAVAALCSVRDLTEHVEALGARLAQRFPSANGAGHDEPTNPEHARPDPEPS